MTKTPFELLGLPESSTAQTVIERWRTLAAVLHPDRGGSADEFDVIRKAYKEALAISQVPMACGTCRGSGKRRISRGFFTMAIDCENCGGTGKVAREP